MFWLKPFSKRLCFGLNLFLKGLYMKLNSDLLILIFGLLIYSIFYVLASFGFKMYPSKTISFKSIFLISLFFGIISYCIKIPLFYYYGQDNIISIYILYISILSVTVSLYSKFILHSKIHTHTYVILLIIFLLIVLNEYLSRSGQGHGHEITKM